jgi:murein DD-endopeptidase MepM/ murein hydrolase activator NlpD
VISRYGAKRGGLHNDGINIAVAKGAPVRASAAGTVVYAGNELRGFGNLVLVRHAGGWTTAYAHNDAVLVKRGDKVRQGDLLARAGSSGSVKRTQVHFEIRRGTEAINPMKFLAHGGGNQTG